MSPGFKVLLLMLTCPLLGGVPLTGWITRLFAGRQLTQLGTGNVSVSAAFYHGGTLAGILAVLAEAGKGLGAVLLARLLFPGQPTWELVALIGLVVGRYWIGRGAGTTNVVWGCAAYDWAVALFVFLIGGISFTVLRQQRQGKILVLLLLPLIIALYRQDVSETLAAIGLSVLMAWIYQKIPDDLDLSAPTGAGDSPGSKDSQQVFQFLRGDRAILSLDRRLDPRQVGQKAATLSQLKRWGYSVPQGWVLPAGDDPAPLIETLDPSKQHPLIVRSSAVGEDSEQASAAGQYRTILHVTSRSALKEAIAECQRFYDDPHATQYRQDQKVPEASMAVLVQAQVQGVFSGVAFSRDPLLGDKDAVAIEALPGAASAVVSGQVTPESYQVVFEPSTAVPEIIGKNGDLPPSLLREVAYLVRDLESRYHGVPQDIEWSYDGRTLWLLQTRPITTLLPIWTRKIAAEVIPGLIHPLTWSVNQPLTCGIWGELFSLGLGKRSRGLDFSQTATLHYARAYFNASLLGQIFRRMGLPPESLEFLTRGASMSKPSLSATLKNIPGLLRLLGRELSLKNDFDRDYQQRFVPILQALADQPTANLSPPELLNRIHRILRLLQPATYYSILAPLSAALRQAFFKVQDQALDSSRTPEAAALRSLQEIATASRHLLGNLDQFSPQTASLFASLADSPETEPVLAQLDRFLDRYGYLSEVGTDIAVPTWKENPQPIRELFTSLLLTPAPESPKSIPDQSWQAKLVQDRLDLKGQVGGIYSQLLAQLRWSFVALEQVWCQSGLLADRGDIFFLELAEIEQIIANDPELMAQVEQLIAQRRSHYQQNCQLSTVPSVVYGSAPDPVNLNLGNWTASEKLQGIGASPGQAEGRVKVLRNLQTLPAVDQTTILVVPYTDAGWAPFLARAGGIISEVGGRLSHGAIIAREYRIPAVMEVAHATQRLREGQQVRIDGQRGTVEILFEQR